MIFIATMTVIMQVISSYSELLLLCYTDGGAKKTGPLVICTSKNCEIFFRKVV